MKELFYLNWTPQQFREWESRTVTIKLELLDMLRIAAKGMAGRTRHGHPDQARWAELVTECETIMEPHIAAIDAMEHPDA